MKRFIYLTAIMILAAASCAKPPVEEQPAAQAELSLGENQKTVITADPEGESISIQFISSIEWTSELEFDTKDKWIEFIPGSGEGGEVYGIAKVKANETKKKRSAELTISSMDKTLVFSFSQKSIKKDETEEDEEDNDGGEDNDGESNGEEDNEGSNDNEGENNEGEQNPDQDMPAIPADPDVTSISSMLAGGTGSVSQGTSIMGYVISNRDLNNLTSLKNMYIQDETAGVMVRFSANHSYNYGDLLKIDISGVTLKEYYSATQLDGVLLENVEVISTGNSVPHKTISMTDFLANKYENQYVALRNVQVTAADMGKTWSSDTENRSINFEDNNGNKFVVFSSKYATYRTQTVPSGSGTLKGIASINNGNIQLIFSTADDWADMTGNRLGEDSGDDSGSSDTQTGGNTKGYLVNYEIPYCELGNISGDYSNRVNETNGGSAYAYIYDTNSSRQRIVTHTFDNGGKDHRNYTFLYDYDKRCPIWLAYHLNNGFCSTNGDRGNAWAYDPAIPEACQPNLSSSYNTDGKPYNRGHMLASNSRVGISNANAQTFYYTNMTPQLSATFNTSAGVWNKLEAAEAAFTPSASSRDTLYVVTGCLFDSQISYTTCVKDGMDCAVPDDFYKCFMLCSFDSNGNITNAKGIGYLFPHEAPTGSYTGYIKSIDDIEDLAGFDFFCNVPENLQKSAEANKTALF